MKKARGTLFPPSCADKPKIEKIPAPIIPPIPIEVAVHKPIFLFASTIFLPILFVL